MSIVEFRAIGTQDVRSSAAWALAAIGIGLALGTSLTILPEGALVGLFGVLGLLFVLILWAMPRPKSVPLMATWALLVAFIPIYGIWPSYVALHLPGLPWISITRIALFTLIGVWLYCIFNSPSLREGIASNVRANRAFYNFLFAFVGCQVLSLPFSSQIDISIARFVVYQIFWTFIIFAVVSLTTTEKRATLLLRLVVFSAAVQIVMGLAEQRYQRLLWLDFLPPGFAADADFLQRVIGGIWRAGEYRVQGSFLTSLHYAEFLVYALPFAIHFALQSKLLVWRIFYFSIYALTLPAVYFSGAKLGMVGFVVVTLTFGTFYVIRRARESKQSLVGIAAIIILPVLLMGFVGAMLSSKRLYSTVMGGGEHQASTEARWTQIEMGLPKVAQRPLFGYGIAMAGPALGFSNAMGVETIDSHVISLLLEVGVLGFLSFMGILIWSFVTAIRLYFFGRAPFAVMAGPIAVCLIAFCTVKLVLAMPDNHTVIYLMMGVTLWMAQAEKEWVAKQAQSLA